MSDQIKVRREEWRKDGEATAYGVPFDKWLAAEYPQEYIAIYHPELVPQVVDAAQFAEKECVRLRDEFAGMALAAGIGRRSSSGRVLQPDALAEEAYQIADAMLRSRAAPNEGKETQ